MNEKTTGNPSWNRTASWRRILLILLVLAPTVIAARTMAALLPSRGGTLLEAVLVVVFAVLFAWISVGFWTAAMGFFLLLSKNNRFSVSRAAAGKNLSIDDPAARTAVLIPICNEDVKRVLAGLRTVYRSLWNTGSLERFDFFLLSDTTDPDVWVEEEDGWRQFCREENASGKVFYRKRSGNSRRKSGNVADFCRRWGKNYRYMIVFDADSIMSGATMVRMVQSMEARRDIGILQTPPSGVNRETLIARVQQFANHVYGPMFAAGLHFWQLGDAQYWGHNAIIRVEPFMKFCQMPRLPGRGPLGGDILSHDFVESALMRRAGYGVWLAYDLEGSWEETPPTLLDELKRDRRWCQGNLQHMRLIFTRGLFPAHRALFLNGILSYGSALLWLAFLLLSSAQAVAEVFFEPVYFPGTKTLFPQWPVWHPHWALTLLASTAVLLFLPKLFSLFLILLKDPSARLFGGRVNLVSGILLEVGLSTLLAPVRMIFHSLFVISTLMGKSVGWGSQSRDDRGTPWSDALRIHWWGTLFGAVWGSLVYMANPSFFPWISPIILSLLLSAPLSVFTSRASLGRTFRNAGIFLIPEEVELPPELSSLGENLQRPEPYTPFLLSRKQGFIRAVADPLVHALHTSLILRYRTGAPGHEKARSKIVEKALAQGPDSLTAREKMEILKAPHHLAELHQRVWELDDRDAAALWGLVLPSGDRGQ